jgi:selenophosphate synthase
MNPQPEKIKQIAKELGDLVAEKNTAYGSSFLVAGDFLKILYPNGIKPEQYQDALILTRIFDKLIRIANKKDAFNESPYNDIAGYGILGVLKDMK